MGTVTIVGLRYAELPTTLALLDRSSRTAGFDVSDDRLRAIETGDAGLFDLGWLRLSATNGDASFRLTSDSAALVDSDAVIICILTPVDEHGVSYKAGVSDVRGSPALSIIDGLAERGAVYGATTQPTTPLDTELDAATPAVIFKLDRNLMYELCRERGEPCVTTTVPASATDAQDFADRVGYPLVAKLANLEKYDPTAALRQVDELAWFARDDLAPFGLMYLRMGWRAMTRPLGLPSSGAGSPRPPRYRSGRSARARMTPQLPVRKALT